MIDITFVCEFIITAITVGLTAFVIPYLIKRFGIENISNAYEIIQILVNSVEQITKVSNAGKAKKSWVIDKLKNDYNVTLDEKVVSDLIEAAVHEMNAAVKK